MNAIRATSDFPDLTSLQVNLLRMGEIIRLASDQGHLLVSLPAELRKKIDPILLAVQMLDYVMVHSGIGLGADPTATRAHIAELATIMAPELTEAQASLVADKIYAHLLQPNDHRKSFRADYFDLKDGVWRPEEFQYMYLTVDDLTNRPLVRLGKEGGIVHCTLLGINDMELLAEMDAMMVRRAIERGQYDSAAKGAAQALRRTKQYRAQIRDHLIRARRSIEAGTWMRDVLPILDDARKHLLRCQADDAAILSSTDDKIDDVRDDLKSLSRLIEVRDTVRECEIIHGQLFHDVCSANDSFRALQGRLFLSRRREAIPDPEEAILIPILKAPLSAITDDIADEIENAFMIAKAPEIADMLAVFAEIAEHEEAADVDPEDEQESQPVVVPKACFDENFVEEVEEWILENARRRGSFSLDEALTVLGDEGLTRAWARCVAVLYIMRYAGGSPLLPEEEMPLQRVIGGEDFWRHCGLEGDDIIIQHPKEVA